MGSFSTCVYHICVSINFSSFNSLGYLNSWLCTVVYGVVFLQAKLPHCESTSCVSGCSLYYIIWGWISYLDNYFSLTVTNLMVLKMIPLKLILWHITIACWTVHYHYCQDHHEYTSILLSCTYQNKLTMFLSSQDMLPKCYDNWLFTYFRFWTCLGIAYQVSEVLNPTPT